MNTIHHTHHKGHTISVIPKHLAGVVGLTREGHFIAKEVSKLNKSKDIHYVMHARKDNLGYWESF